MFECKTNLMCWHVKKTLYLLNKHVYESEANVTLGDLNLRILWCSGFYVSDGDPDIIVVIVTVAVTVHVLTCSLSSGLRPTHTRLYLTQQPTAANMWVRQGRLQQQTPQW